MSEATLCQSSVRPRRNLTLLGALGLSLGIVGPSLAMSGNGQGSAALVGKAVPLIFVLGAIGIMLISHSFVRLTQRYNQAGSAYALVGKTLGPRAGFFSGWGVMLTYLFFAIGNVGAIGSFTNALIDNAQGNPAHPFHVPWLLSGGIGLLLAALLATRDFRKVVKTLLWIEGIGVLSMTILCIVIFAKGGNHHTTGIDFSTFSFKGQSFSGIMGATVGAFLSWGGFEGAAALGEETNNPSRNIPRALLACVIGTSVLFVVVMFAQTVGFGTDAAGIHAFSTSGNSLAQLGHMYVGLWFSLVLSFTAVMSSFGCLLGSAGTTGRLLFAFSRDGVGPRSWGRLDVRGEPTKALLAVVGVTFAVSLISFVVGHPVLGTGDSALDMYFYYSVIGAITLMVAYLMVEFAAIRHLVTERREKIAEVGLPILGAFLIVAVFYYNVKSQNNWVAPPFVAFALMAVGLVICVTFPNLASKVSAGLNRDLGEAAGKELIGSSGIGLEPFPTSEIQ
jgi:amino acid transporter